MKLYLAGPMRGLPSFNFPTFDRGANWLRGQGHEVFNPAEWESYPVVRDRYDRDPLSAARECFARDTDYICHVAEGVALLPGWRASKGAVAEAHLARAIGLRVYYLIPRVRGWHLVEETLG